MIPLLHAFVVLVFFAMILTVLVGGCLYEIQKPKKEDVNYGRDQAKQN